MSGQALSSIHGHTPKVQQLDFAGQLLCLQQAREGLWQELVRFQIRLLTQQTQ